MSIIGVTVGTPTSPKRIEDEIKPVKTVNGNAPDENGNVEVIGNKGADGKDGVDGISPTISVSTITGGHRITVTDKNGTKNVDVMDGADGADGEDGKDGINGSNGTNGKDGQNGKDGANGTDGVGIANIAKTSTNGKVDTYTITLTNDATTTFTVTNGADGTDGKDGDKGETGAAGADGKDGTSVTITNVNESTADGGSNTVTFSDGKTLTVKNGSKGSAGKDGSDGANGADGRGIKTIQRVNGNGAAGTTDRYQVAYTDDTSTYFYIYNGADGADGTNGDDGKSAYQYAKESGYTGTEAEFAAKLATPALDLSSYAKTANHYTKTESDNKYQAKGNYLTAVPSEYVTETELNNKGYLTSHQDISGKADKSSAETWTFKLKDGSTVTKKVVLA